MPAIKQSIEYGSEGPMMPDGLWGVRHLRGAVMAVIDLSVRFGRPRTQEDRRTVIVDLVQKGPVGAASRLLCVM